MEINNDLDMNVFMGEDFLSDNEELEQELNILNPSEDVDPEIVASKNQDGGASNKSPQEVVEDVPIAEVSDEDEEDEQSLDEPVSPNSSLYSSLANVLYNEGALPDLDLENNKIEDIDGLVNAIKGQTEANEFRDLTDRQKRYLEVLKEGVPEELFLETEKVNADLDTIDSDFLENEENAEVRSNLIKEYFTLKGFEEDEASNLTQQQVDLATDVEFSKKALKAIKAYNNSRVEDSLERARAEKAKQAESFENLKQSINDTNSIIEGINIDKKAKKEVLDYITKPVETLENGVQINAIQKAQMEDPVKFQQNLAYLLYLTKGFKDFSKFSSGKKARSKAVKEFENVLTKSTMDMGGSDIIDIDSIDLGDLNGF